MPAPVSIRALNEIEAKQLLAQAGVRVVPTELARTPDQAVAVCERLGLPAAMKIVSPDVIHKSDVGGVRLDLSSPNEVATAYREMMAQVSHRLPRARIDGVAMQPMAESGGVEVIVGVSVDPQFGHVVMCGLGGILVEVLHDVSFRLLPVDRREACRMLTELRGAAVLHGIRGKAAVNIEALADLIVAVSNLVFARTEIREIDLNPILAYADGAVAVDARVLLEEP